MDLIIIVSWLVLMASTMIYLEKDKKPSYGIIVIIYAYALFWVILGQSIHMP